MGVITDPLADLLVRIRNANQRQHKSVDVPYSFLKVRFVRKMVEAGFLSGYNVSGKLKTKMIAVKLKFVGSKPALRGLKRVSTPGLRVYVTTNKIPWVLSGYGVAILSTSQGILTDKEARKAKVGGEVLAYLW